ncbi:THAP domain-containing 2-like [Paramuricea clavata]|uniref:THAP domain-containing 2-like n=1 Tax=Paramuricea clavata TaxID=317549 RepID=A0A7D9DJQ2_PARCT|nr:THAP domain-containing 2-like [Paramuricea clavata]
MAEPKYAATKTTKNLGKYCVAGAPNNESCKNNSTTPGISMHEFPKPGNQLRNLWIKFVRRHRMADWQPSPYSCLCSAHFDPQSFISDLTFNTNRLKCSWIFRIISLLG